MIAIRQNRAAKNAWAPHLACLWPASRCLRWRPIQSTSFVLFANKTPQLCIERSGLVRAEACGLVVAFVHL